MQSFFLHKFFIVFIAVFLFSGIAGTQYASACSIGPGGFPTGEESYERSEVVFIGTVESVKRDRDINGNIYITFTVEESYKGVVADSTVEVRTGGNSALCGYDDMDVFEVGSVWSIYASDDLYTTSVTSNTQYATVSEAIQEVDSFADITSTEPGNENETFACMALYDPVCGQVDTGIRCVTAPCPSFEQKTFSNACFLEKEGAVFLHNGVCNDTSVVPEQPVQNQIPVNCKRWYDGCNWCSRSEVGGPAACTKRACFQQEMSYCEVIFSETETTTNNSANEEIVVVTNDAATSTTVDNSLNQQSNIPQKRSVITVITSFFTTLGNFFKNLF